MSTQVITVVLAIINLLLGGGLIALLRYRIQSRGENRVDFNTVLAEVKAQRDEAWVQIREQDNRIGQMEVEIQGLRLARDLDPFPNWVADLQGRYIFVNREFEKLFLEPRGETYRDAIGQGHADIWPSDFCRTIMALDAAARSRPDGTARAVTSLDVPNLGACKVTVHKFPIRFKPSGVIVAFAGYITDLAAEEEIIR
jgi:PAS domain-containing protein